MAHTIKVSGVTEELLALLDQRWRRGHYGDRSEYVRDLIRRDVLSSREDPRKTLAENVKAVFGAVHDEAESRGYSEADIASFVDAVVAETRVEYGKSPRSTGSADGPAAGR